MTHPIALLLIDIIGIYYFILIVWVILSLLIYFNIVNSHQPLVQKLNYILFRLTEPVLKYIRRVIPPIGGMDLSPLALMILLHFAQNMLYYYF